MCVHLQPAEEYIKSKGLPEHWRGQPWIDNCREWVYFDCVFDPATLKERLQLADFINVHDYYDPKAGAELGLVCPLCKDAVMGNHPRNSAAGRKIVID